MRTYLLPLIALLLLALAGPALAVDGVLEINQTCAVQTGCFPSDMPLYPVTIGEPGSYRLTSNLIVPDEHTDGIKVGSSGVTIDLNGFEIVRSGCEGAITDCAPALGTGSGVARISSLNRGTSVQNGSITGMGLTGVLLGDQAEVSKVRVRWNRLDGIRTNDGSTVTGNTAYQNGRDGIDASAGTTISGNTAYLNGGDGIQAGSGSTVQLNTVRSNGEYGLNLASDAGYRENVITGTVTATTGTVAGGVNAGGNVCNGSLTCP